MLVIPRRKNESVVINNDVTVTVIEVRGDKVRLGITHPKEVAVHRQEVYDALHGGPPPRPPEEGAFLRAVLEAPEDDGPRLIFADWLEERGDPRGEFIRVQCVLAKLPADDPRRKGLEERQRALREEHGRAWRAYLPAVLRSATLERGFVETVRLTIAEFLVQAEAMFEAAPVRRLRAVGSWAVGNGGMLASLAASPYLARLAELDLGGMDLGDGEVAALTSSAHAGSLKTLKLQANRIGDGGAIALASSSHLAGLATLDLAGNRVGDAGARALAASPHLAGLTRIDLSGNPIGGEAAGTLRARFGERVRL